MARRNYTFSPFKKRGILKNINFNNYFSDKYISFKLF